MKKILSTVFLLGLFAVGVPAYAANFPLQGGKMVIGQNDGILTAGGQFSTNVNLADAWGSGKTNGVVNTNPWNPAFLDVLKNYQVLRFMDSMATNSSTARSWDARRTPGDEGNKNVGWGHPASGGISYEWIIDLGNRTGMDVWITVPHLSYEDDEYWTELAKLFKENLNDNVRVWIEYSNETWNGSVYFNQTAYAKGKAGELGLPEFGFQPYAAIRLWDAFEKEFGKNSPQVVKVLAGWSSAIRWNANWPENEHWSVINSNQHNPNEIYPDVYAIAPYFSSPDDGAIANATAEIAAHYAITQKYGVGLVAYEGGEHTDNGATKDQASIEGHYTKYLNDISPYLSLFVNYKLFGPTWGMADTVGGAKGSHVDNALQAYMEENGVLNPGDAGNADNDNQDNNQDDNIDDAGNEEENLNNEDDAGNNDNNQNDADDNVPAEDDDDNDVNLTDENPEALDAEGAAVCHGIRGVDPGKVPQDFAYPWDEIAAGKPILSRATCAGDAMTLTAGTGANTHFVWNKAYVSKDGANWEATPFTLTGNHAIAGNDKWLLGTGTAIIPMSAADLNTMNFIATYSCTWTGTEWKCGCRDEATCTENGKWNLQIFGNQYRDDTGDDGNNDDTGDDTGDDGNDDGGSTPVGEGFDSGITLCTGITPLSTAGATVVGNGTPASCTEAALDAVIRNGGAIAFNCGADPHTISITTEKMLSTGQDTIIDGGGLITLDGRGATRILNMAGDHNSPTPTVTVQNIRMIGGQQPQNDDAHGGGAMRRIGGSFNIINSTFEDNHAPAQTHHDGGAVWSRGSGGLTHISGSIFRNNSANNGGAIGVRMTNLIIENSIVENNQTVFDEHGGGGIFIDGNGQDVTMCGLELKNNSTGYLGGGFFRVSNDDGGTQTIEKSTITGNTSRGGSDAFYLQGTAQPITGSFSDNTITGSMQCNNITGGCPNNNAANNNTTENQDTLASDENDFSQGAISLTFDDGTTSHLENALPILDAANIKGSFYIITDAMSRMNINAINPGTYMSPALIQKIQDSGHEIGAHSKKHPNLTGLSLAEAHEEIEGSREALLAEGFTPVDTFVYPYGAHNTNIINMLKEAGFKGARTTIIGFNDTTTNPYQLKIQAVGVNTTRAQILDLIKQAKENQSWLILMLHKIDDSGDPYTSSPALLQDIVDDIRDQNLKVVTMGEGIDLLK